MNEEVRRQYEEEIEHEMKYLHDEMKKDSSLQEVAAPSTMKDNIFGTLKRKKERLSEREKELIALGKVYEKKRKKSKYYVIATVMVLTLALGITSMGGVETIFNKVSWMIGDRKQENVNSEDIEPVQCFNEEDAYAKIEEEFGFLPVRMLYVPSQIEFLEATLGDEILGTQIVYGIEEQVRITYFIRPNYRNSSMGRDIEDTLISEYEDVINNKVFYIKEYQVEDGTHRWSVQFEYQDVTYSILMLDIEENEVKKIIENLYFI